MTYRGQETRFDYVSAPHPELLGSMAANEENCFPRLFPYLLPQQLEYSALSYYLAGY